MISLSHLEKPVVLQAEVLLQGNVFEVLTPGLLRPMCMLLQQAQLIHLWTMVTFV